MALPNNDPIYSRRGAITRSVILKLASTTDYTGIHANTQEVFAADATNGSFLQRIRFKALGTNVATVARIYLNNGFPNENWAAAPTAPSGGTPPTTGGTILAGSYYGLVIAIDAYGAQSAMGAMSAAATTTGSTSVINWTWTAVAGAVSYRLYVGNVATQGTQDRYFTSATNSYSQTAMHYSGTYDDPQVGNTKFYGEISLPATTASATAATPDVDYPLNIALPPGWEVYVGIATAVAAGWSATGIGGDY